MLRLIIALAIYWIPLFLTAWGPFAGKEKT